MKPFGVMASEETSLKTDLPPLGPVPPENAPRNVNALASPEPMAQVRSCHGGSITNGIPKSINERNSLINCWFCMGMFQGYVWKFLKKNGWW